MTQLGTRSTEAAPNPFPEDVLTYLKLYNFNSYVVGLRATTLM